MARATIINDIRKYLVKENIYTPKDEITLILLENTYTLYVHSVKEVKSQGQTIQQVDFKGRVRNVINPSFRNMLESQKQLFKLIDSLYLSPKSRKTKKETTVDETDPFIEMLKNINETK